jgi:lipid-binding SYLF domain-containing protein
MKAKPGVKRLMLLAALVASQSAQAGLFGPKGDGPDEKKATVRQQRDEMLAELYSSKPALKETIQKAAGYATFKNVNVNLLLLATANGYGMAVDNKSGKETFMRMASLGGGVGAGVKDVRVIFIFHDPATMKQFVEEGWQFGGQADAAAKYKDTGVAGEQSAKANVSAKQGSVSGGASTDIAGGVSRNDSSATRLATKGGIEIYQFTQSGVALQATVSGTKYWKDGKLNE